MSLSLSLQFQFFNCKDLAASGNPVLKIYPTFFSQQKINLTLSCHHIPTNVYEKGLYSYLNKGATDSFDQHILTVLLPKGGFPVMAETTRNHIFSKEISQVIIAAMVLAPNFY